MIYKFYKYQILEVLNMKNVLILMSAFVIAFMITLSSFAACPFQINCQGCNDKIINTEKACNRTSWEVIKYSRKLSKFERIVKKAGMQDALNCGNYIVLAPTNSALKCVKFDCPEEARKFVMNHLVDAKCYPNELCTYDKIKTLSGEEFCIKTEGNMMMIKDSIVIVSNVQTQTGRIYVLDSALR
jgi:uncharacterized surface protein with fasciclin (FAS1) repeats